MPSELRQLVKTHFKRKFLQKFLKIERMGADMGHINLSKCMAFL